jgi:propionyl-CoA carboxylase alpha chain
VRNDAGVREGDAISMYYDPMISKLCAWGPTRADAVEGMARALEGFRIEGLGHNLPFLSAVMDQERFRSGAFDQLHRRRVPRRLQGPEPSPFQTDLLTAVACWMQRCSAAGPARRTRRLDRLRRRGARAVRLRGEAPLSVELVDDE